MKSNHHSLLTVLQNGVFRVAVILGAVVVVFLFTQFVIFRDIERAGPESQNGNRVTVEVCDRGLGWGRDYYTHISIVDKDGKRLAYWRDPDGQQGAAEAEAVIRSIHWISATTIRFKTAMRDEVTLSAEGTKSEQVGAPNDR